MKTHMFTSTQKWFTEHKTKLLRWPSQSTVLDPRDNLWGELKRRGHKRGLRTLGGLERFCKEERTECCFIGKWRLCKILNAGVPITVAHVVLLKIIMS